MSKNKPDNPIYERDLIEANKFRRTQNLPDIKTGNRYCLKCDKKFFSQDLAREKICYACKCVKIR